MPATDASLAERNNKIYLLGGYLLLIHSQTQKFTDDIACICYNQTKPFIVEKLNSLMHARAKQEPALYTQTQS